MVPMTGRPPVGDKPADGSDARRRRLEELFAAHGSTVYAYARRRTSAADADEVVADTFLVAWRRLDAVPANDALPWLLAVARRTLANRLRGDARRSALQLRLAAAQSPDTTGDDDRHIDDRVRAALAALPAREREALTLLAWDDLSPDEIATVLGCTRAAVYLRLSRARRRLQRALGTPPSSPEEGLR